MRQFTLFILCQHHWGVPGIEVLFFAVSFLACAAGTICGIGGGVIIKPALDMLGLASVASVSFLSGCTVLSMSAYSIAHAFVAKDSLVDVRKITPLAIGAAVGGVCGNRLFEWVKNLSPNPNHVGAIQAAGLAAITLGAIVYTLLRAKIRTKTVENHFACAGIGLVLGMASSFMGIGGGPINLLALHFFYSMPAKIAAQNSLYIILFSQAANLLAALVARSVPPFAWPVLLLMVTGGILGGVLGRSLYKRMNHSHVSNLLVALLVLIVLICGYNVYRYL